MLQSASVPLPGPEFDAFLFASVGDDSNGMRLSVLSALARLDVDPWQEAASLALLPGRSAVERLTSLIAALPDGPAAQGDSATIAARLVALLPRGTGSRMSAKSLPGLGAAINSQSVISVFVVNMIFVAIMLGAQWLAVSHQMPATSSDNLAAATHAAAAHPSAPNAGQ